MASLKGNDNDKNYCKENCRWATRSEQGKNTSRIRYLTYDDKTRSVRDWERHLKFGRDVISDRINKLGWSIERALSTKKVRVLNKNRYVSMGLTDEEIIDLKIKDEQHDRE